MCLLLWECVGLVQIKVAAAAAAMAKAKRLMSYDLRIVAVAVPRMEVYRAPLRWPNDCLLKDGQLHNPEVRSPVGLCPGTGARRT